MVDAAGDLIQDEGLEALSMRALADRLEVKAASLYWHVRDRRELLEMLADSILSEVPSTSGGQQWRLATLRLAGALRDLVAAHRDADRILLEVPEAWERSDVFARLKRLLQSAGLQPSESAEVARLVMVHVITARSGTSPPPTLESGRIASIAIDSGSRGVVLRRGAAMDTLIRVPHDPSAVAPAIAHGETVVVRRLRGSSSAEIELNPSHPWRFKIQGPTWNTVLNLAGLEVREIKLDSGAAKVECFLPEPRGVVPINVSGGVVGLKLHRQQGTSVVANVSTGAVQVKLDAYSVRAVTMDLQWESAGAAANPDRYELRISGGAVHVSLDEDAPVVKAPHTSADQQPESGRRGASALDILLDGVERRASGRVQ
jgi:AcrR family transcriptional regulator